VAFIPKVGEPSPADAAYTLVKEAKEIAHILLKEVDRPRFTASDIVRIMHKQCHRRFMIYNHTELWKSLNARKEESFGKQGQYNGTRMVRALGQPSAC
jgi:hypothetical protein